MRFRVPAVCFWAYPLSVYKKICRHVLLLIVLLLAGLCGGVALAQELDWAKRAGGIINDWGRGIAVDRDGTIYLTGFFPGTATFGPGEANETMLTSAGSFDIFVAKYDADGELVWVKQAGGTNSDQGLGIAADGSGNSYVIGVFSGTATFGPGEANQTVLTSAGSNDIFVAKYDANGELVWAKRAGGTSGDQGLGIATDGSGTSYVTGLFLGTVTFGPGEANETVLTSAGSFDIFVAKYDANGELVWAKRAGGASGDQGLGIAIDGSGNSYVTGFFTGMATFGAGEANETILSGAGGNEIFIAKYDANGELVWAKRAGGTSGDHGLGIAADGSGNSYVTGLFLGTVTFGPGEANETILTSAGNDDIFVAKYDANGELVWAKRAGGTSGDRGHGIAIDGEGSSYVTGFFGGMATFGLGEANETTLTSADFADVFIAKFDADGELVWSKRAGGTSRDIATGIAVDGSGNAYVTGFFAGTATFGLGEANETTLTSAGSDDIFVAKISASATPVNQPAVTADDSFATDENVPLSVSAPGVLANDSDVDGDTLTAILVSGPANGALSLNADGSFTYIPNPNFHGADSFTYKANDGALDSNVATVTITVNAVNTLDALVAAVQELELNPGVVNSLMSKLRAAEQSLAKGQQKAAHNQLNAFINEVTALKRSGRLDTEAADALIARARALQNGLQ